MLRKTQSRPTRAMAFVLGMSLCTLPLASAQAGMLGTDQLVSQHQQAQHRSEINTLLARQDIANYLRDQGVDGAELQGRVNALSEDELRLMHGKLQDLPTGESFLGAVLAIIVIFLLLDMGGVTDVFPNV